MKQARRRPGDAAAPAGRHGVLIDTGVLVALHLRDDPRHARTAGWFAAFQGELHTTDAVLTEVAHFVTLRSRVALAELAAGGRLALHRPDAAAYARMADLFRKYADQDPDWVDIELVWLAESTGISRIATLDVADFSVYRINGRKRFELELLR